MTINHNRDDHEKDGDLFSVLLVPANPVPGHQLPPLQTLHHSHLSARKTIGHNCQSLDKNSCQKTIATSATKSAQNGHLCTVMVIISQNHHHCTKPFHKIVNQFDKMVAKIVQFYKMVTNLLTCLGE